MAQIRGLVAGECLRKSRHIKNICIGCILGHQKVLKACMVSTHIVQYFYYNNYIAMQSQTTATEEQMQCNTTMTWTEEDDDYDMDTREDTCTCIYDYEFDEAELHHSDEVQ